MKWKRRVKPMYKISDFFNLELTDTQKEIITSFLNVATNGEPIINTNSFIEHMYFTYGDFGISNTMCNSSADITPDNYAYVFLRTFGTGASLSSVYNALVKFAELLKADKTVTRRGDENNTNNNEHTEKHSGALTTTKTGTVQTANGGNVTTTNGGNIVEDKTTSLGAWGAENTESAQNIHTTTTPANTETVADGRTETETHNRTDTENDNRQIVTNGEDTGEKTYNETIQTVGGHNPEYAQYFKSDLVDLSLNARFCAEFVKKYCITVFI